MEQKADHKKVQGLSAHWHLSFNAFNLILFILLKNVTAPKKSKIALRSLPNSNFYLVDTNKFSFSVFRQQHT